MKKLLRIDSSLFGEESVSRQLTGELTQTLQKNHLTLQVAHRDLSAQEVPHIDSKLIMALNTPSEQRSTEQRKLVAYADSLINEVMTADTLLIGAPMYNFSTPSVLKSWFDHITRAGVTFRYTSEGAEGLLKNKQAIVITTRGGIHRDQPSDSEALFLQNILSFLGIKQVHFIYAEGLNMGNNQREKGLRDARQQIQKLPMA